MGRSDVTVQLGAHHATNRELALPVTLALGMPANERMDGLVEKATELGAATVQPLVCERSVLRLAGERAERKTAHWQAVAVAACEQSGRNRVPTIAAPLALREWLAQQATATAMGGRMLLSLDPEARPLAQALAGAAPAAPSAAAVPGGFTLLSGPEGGLSLAEILAAQACGFVPVSLGARVLRADTAPLAALAVIAALQAGGA
jgi:16S rRNA (uracil1498-N3)-methyltransferase